MIRIKNYTQPEEFAYADQHPLLPKHPFRLLITGPSGCGKTNLLLNFIYDWLKFDNLYVCAKDIFEPKYSSLQETYTQFNDIEEDDILNLKKVKKVDKEKFLEMFHKFKKETLFTSELSDFITVDELDPSVKNLVVFDDCVTEKKQKVIEDLFIRGRKKNASIIYISQSYYSTPINIRKNCNYFIFFQLQPREVKQILREIDGSLTSGEFNSMYKTCVTKPHDFFMLDLVNPEMRYRKCFDPLNKTWNKN